MDLHLYNTPHGLVPLYEEDYDEKKKLKIGETYLAKIRLERNSEFHKRFFAMINTAWSYLPEKRQNGFRSVDGFRQYVTVAAGFYDVYFSPLRGEFVEVPQSIAFENMDQAKFQEVYKAVKDVVFSILKEVVSEKEFESVVEVLMRF
jgi:hypothetical protein